MSVLKRFNKLMFVFFFLGLTPYHAKNDHIKLRTKSYVPSVPLIISSVLNVSVFGLQLYVGHTQSFGLINSIISMAALLTAMVSNLSAIFQCYFYPVVYRNLIDQINKIEKNFKVNFSENLPSLAFALRYRRKMIIIFCLAIIREVTTIVMLWNSFNIDGILIGVLQTVTNIFSVVVTIHAILYVDVAQMCLRVLNVSIKNSPACLHSAAKLEFLKYVKLMHMDLWKLVTQINHFFSWSLLNFTINFMINSVNDLYQIFRGLQPGIGVMWALAGVFELVFDSTSTVMVVNSCHYCTLERKHLIENVEQYTFWTNEDFQIYQLKHETLSQIRNFPITIGASGFFNVSREHLGGICATCCTYIIIFIQFFLSVDSVE